MPGLLQPEKACAQQGRPSAAKKQETFKKDYFDLVASPFQVRHPLQHEGKGMAEVCN